MKRSDTPTDKRTGCFSMRKIIFLIAVFLAAAFLNTALSESESFLVLSDLHLTEEAQGRNDVLNAVIRAAQGRDAVLLLGDNTNNSHAEEHALVLEWAREIGQQTGAEVYIIPGNHDYSRYFGPEEFSARYRPFGRNRAFSRDTSSASYAVMTGKGNCLLMLDTNQFDRKHFVLPDGSIGEGTLDWVREVLAELPEGTPVLACGHHPILPPEREARTPGARGLSQVLRAYGAGLYLCGHDHGFAAAEQEGLRQITTGQPHAFPGWAGILERDQGAFLWHTEQLYDEQSPFFIQLRENAASLGRPMARGTLEGTPYAEDEEAVEWFAAAFMLFAGGDMTQEKSARLLADENCRKWRLVETRTVVKDWIIGLLENNPEDVRRIFVPASQKYSADD